MPSLLRLPSSAAAAILLFAAAASAANFTCHTPTTCRSTIGYSVPNATTYAALASFFNTSTITIQDLLGANNLPPDTPRTTPIPANATVRVPFPCRCSGGIGQSDGVPIYIVKPLDFLDAIARNVYDAFVTYQEIATANNITNPSLIGIGQELKIPLPCSCDQVHGSDVMHYAYRVTGGDTTPGIAATFGVSEPALIATNSINDPKSLLKGQILDVPLPVCQSAVSNNSQDHDRLRLPNGTYALTAGNCISCSCSAATYQLNCTAVSSARSCPAPQPCNGTLQLGETNGSGCTSATCAYSGYSNATSLSIHTTLMTNQTAACKSGGSARAEFARSMWRSSLVAFHMALILICFL